MNKPQLSHNDSPSLEDGFDQTDFIDKLCRIIIDCQPPKGIGINGYWGTGKTTTLLNLYCRFSSVDPYNNSVPSSFNSHFREQKVIPIWFEAWRYQHETLPIVALLNEIRSQITFWNSLPKKTKKLSNIALLGVSSAIEEGIKSITGGLFQPKISHLQQLGEKWETENYLNPLPCQAIHQLLEEAIASVSKTKEKHRLLILIDDLDRCNPEKALQLMEGIKIHLNLNNCVVVFGMDQRQVERALVKSLGLMQSYDIDNQQNQAQVCHQAQEYLEKICQDIYHIPVPNQQAKTAYFIGLIEQIVDEKIKQEVAQESTKVLTAFDCLPANPRKIKALANRFAIMREVSNRKLTEREYTLLMGLAILYTFHRRVYQQIEKDPKYINTVLEYAKSNNDQDADKYEPMKGMIVSVDNQGKKIPRNPSDSNIFRLHHLFIELDTISDHEIPDLIGLT